MLLQMRKSRQPERKRNRLDAMMFQRPTLLMYSASRKMQMSSSSLINLTLRPFFCYHVLVACISHGSFLCYDITFEGYTSDTIPLHSIKHQFTQSTHRPRYNPPNARANNT